MSIESNVFSKKTILFESLINYGFIKENDKYLYKCDLVNSDFYAIIEIESKGIVKGKVFDKATDEEYLPFRLENYNISFVNGLRGEYEKILIDIANHCCKEELFSSPQANRITKKIFEKYNERPNFPWSSKKDSGSGTFKHQENGKWYALIMNIKMKILDKTCNSDLTVDVINMKSDDVENLIRQDGIYEAYHMNHKKWISVILNDTISDDIVMTLLDKSYLLTLAK